MPTLSSPATLNTTAIPAFKDNYIWLHWDPNTRLGLVVDPGDAQPVIAVLEQLDIRLCAILITHHHWDHSGGIEALLQTQAVPVWGPAHETIPHISHRVSEGDRVSIPELQTAFTVLDIPGHTKGHIAFMGEGLLFCGDTLFAGGCGRLFEGTAQQLLNSLQKIAAQPDKTQLYCAHEYTVKNLQFALTLEPGNDALVERYQTAQRLRAQQVPTIPSTLSLEKATNPFLRTHVPALIQPLEARLNRKNMNELEVFTALRALKDNF